MATKTISTTEALQRAEQLKSLEAQAEALAKQAEELKSQSKEAIQIANAIERANASLDYEENEINKHNERVQKMFAALKDVATPQQLELLKCTFVNGEKTITIKKTPYYYERTEDNRLGDTIELTPVTHEVTNKMVITYRGKTIRIEPKYSSSSYSSRMVGYQYELPYDVNKRVLTNPKTVLAKVDEYFANQARAQKEKEAKETSENIALETIKAKYGEVAKSITKETVWNTSYPLNIVKVVFHNDATLRLRIYSEGKFGMHDYSIAPEKKVNVDTLVKYLMS